MTSAVVVGSGPNGLAAAIRLAQAGVEVTVLEASDRPGGGTRTSESTVPGLLHDDCSAFHPFGVVSPFLRSLGLDRYGLEWAWPEVDLAHPLDDGRAGLISRDLARTLGSLGTDARTWQRTFMPLVRDFDRLLAEIMRPVLHVPRRPLRLALFGAQALLPATWLARRWDDEPARALFLGVAAHAFSRLDAPLSASVGLVLTAAGHCAGWPVAKGGSRAISAAMVALLEHLGGTVTTGVTVAALEQLRDVTGVSPDVVMLDTSPTAALKIVGDRVPRRIARQLQRFRYGPAVHKVDFAIRGDVPWANPEVRRAGTVHLGGASAQVAAAEAATARGVMPDRPFVLVGQQYLADPSRSRGDLNPLWAYAHVPHAYRGDATGAVVAQIERFAPGFRDTIVATAVRGPAAMERYDANYVGGDIGSGANTARQIVMRPRAALNPYALGVDGVYLCSSATPPGGGVHGMCGSNAAQVALART